MQNKIRSLLFTLLALISLSAQATVIAEYNFNGNANDTSGNGYNGALGGNAGFGAGIFGQALTLDGNGDYVGVTMPTQALTAFTLETWFNSATAAPSGPHLISMSDTNNYNVLWGLSNSNISGWSNGTSPVNLTAPLGAPLLANTWYHAAFTYDGAQTKMYINGVLVGANAVTGGLTGIGGPISLGIGARHTLNTQFFQGSLDNVRIHDNALSRSELEFFADASSVPETSATLAIFSLGLAGLCLARRFLGLP